jgi:hypothetical protein
MASRSCLTNPFISEQRSPQPGSRSRTRTCSSCSRPRMRRCTTSTSPPTLSDRHWPRSPLPSEAGPSPQRASAQLSTCGCAAPASASSCGRSDPTPRTSRHPFSSAAVWRAGELGGLSNAHLQVPIERRRLRPHYWQGCRRLRLGAETVRGGITEEASEHGTRAWLDFEWFSPPQLFGYVAPPGAPPLGQHLSLAAELQPRKIHRHG